MLRFRNKWLGLMRILISNDDGYLAPGISALARALEVEIPQEIYDQLLLRMEAGGHD